MSLLRLPSPLDHDFYTRSLPIIIFIFLTDPETAGRTLEEIDIIFAKAHVEGKKPTHVANDMEKLTQTQVERVTNALDIHNVRGDDLEKGGVPAGKLASGDTTPSETRSGEPGFREEAREDGLTDKFRGA